MESIIHTKGITSKNGLISSEIGRGGQDFFYTLYHAPKTSTDAGIMISTSDFYRTPTIQFVTIWNLIQMGSRKAIGTKKSISYPRCQPMKQEWFQPNQFD
jgi:hypothetical protein